MYCRMVQHKILLYFYKNTLKHFYKNTLKDETIFIYLTNAYILVTNVSKMVTNGKVKGVKRGIITFRAGTDRMYPKEKIKVPQGTTL